VIVELVISDDKVNYEKYTVVYLPHIQALKCHKCITGGVSKPLWLDRYFHYNCGSVSRVSGYVQSQCYDIHISLEPQGPCLTRAGPEIGCRSGYCLYRPFI